MQKRLLTLSFIGLLILTSFNVVGAENSVTLLSQDVNYEFGEQLRFEARIESQVQIESVELVLAAPGVPTFIGTVSTSSSDELRFVYDLNQRPLRLFSTVSYYYRFRTESGEELKSQTYTFPYIDNRFQWQSLEADKFNVYWYEGDVTFARDVLDAAEAGREEVLELLQRPKNNRQISIYVYAQQDDLQSTLALSKSSWVGGHADPELGSVVVALPPGADRDLQVQRQIPHEITHVMLYRFMGDGYQYLPRWTNEGIASIMELFPNPEYDILLEKAYQEGRLIPVRDLCHTLPGETDQVRLAYAESSSLLSYIMREYGITAVRAMISAYDQGVSCDRGVEMALNRNLDTLEREWKRDVFGGGIWAAIGGTYLPVWIVIGVVCVAVFGFLIRQKIVRESDEDGGHS